jgi:protein-L-isoaspartate(D-aspartate) O-methyltransferase
MDKAVFEAETAAARVRMVDALTASVHPSAAVLGAMARVPRHAFLRRFWAFPGGFTSGPAAALREWRMNPEEADVHAIELAYAPDRALAILPEHVPGGATSTASAPDLMATMLDLLDLHPGQRVLEIGAGSGYNAALLAELVGDAASITTIDIDVAVAERAQHHLTEAGYGDVQVVAADGFYGAPDAAPFDRIVATVGCSDLSPWWLQQLTSDGYVIVPLEHAATHPIVRAVPRRDGATGRVMAPSAFVRVQGRLAQPGRWSSAPVPNVSERMVAEPLPRELGRALVRPGRAEWDLSYLVGLEDRRAVNDRGPALAEGGAAAAIDAVSGRVVWSGRAGRPLRDALLDHARTWLDLGSPSASDFLSEWEPLDQTHQAQEARTVAGKLWSIDRVAFRQLVRLR